MKTQRKVHIWKMGGVLLGALGFASACVTDDQFRYLNSQIVDLNTRMERQEGAVGTATDARMEAITGHQARTDAEMHAIRTEVQSLVGQVEDNTRLVNRAIERDTTEADNIRMQLSELEKKASELDLRLARIDTYLGLKPAPEVQEEEAQVQVPEKPAPEVASKPAAAPPPPARPAPPPAPVAPAPPEAVEPDKRLYEVTLAQYRDGKFEEAVAGFRSFLEKYPESDMAESAHFWIGQSHLSLKQYERAILAYQEVIKKYPKGNRVPGAMLGQAEAFQAIKDRTSARILLERLVANHPKSKEAETAKQRLQSLR